VIGKIDEARLCRGAEAMTHLLSTGVLLQLRARNAGYPTSARGNHAGMGSFRNEMHGRSAPAANRTKKEQVPCFDKTNPISDHWRLGAAGATFIDENLAAVEDATQETHVIAV
jgi:hypothetical protein